MIPFKKTLGIFLNSDDVFAFFPFFKTIEKIENGEVGFDNILEIINGRFLADKTKRGIIKKAVISGGSFENIDFKNCFFPEISQNRTTFKNCNFY